MKKQKKQDDLCWNRTSMIEERMWRLMALGYRLFMSAKVLGHYSDMPLHKDAIDVFHALKTETTANDYQCKHQEHFDQLTNQERIDLFTRNKKILKMINKDEQQNLPDFDYDIRKPGSLQDLGFTCFCLSLWYSLLYNSGTDDQDDEAITALFMVDEEFTRISNEAIGYWLAKQDVRMPKKNSGIGQKKAEEVRLNEVLAMVKPLAGDNDNEDLTMRKGMFIKMVNRAFKGAEETQRHHATIKKYKKKIEEALGKKITFKKVP